MIKVAVIDDHSVVLAGLTFVLSKERDMSVAATADSAEGIVAFWEKHKPDVLLLDIRMPVVSGLEALERIKKAHPEARVAMLTTSDLEEDIFRALNLGAAGYILKDERPAAIAAAIRTIAAGEMHLPENLRKIYEMRKAAKGLSEREAAILQYAARGLQNTEIGELLGISANTVKSHIRHAFEKLEVTTRTEAISQAIARGIINA